MPRWHACMVAVLVMVLEEHSPISKLNSTIELILELRTTRGGCNSDIFDAWFPGLHNSYKVNLLAPMLSKIKCRGSHQARKCRELEMCLRHKTADIPTKLCPLRQTMVLAIMSLINADFVDFVDLFRHLIPRSGVRFPCRKWLKSLPGQSLICGSGNRVGSG